VSGFITRNPGVGTHEDQVGLQRFRQIGHGTPYTVGVRCVPMVGPHEVDRSVPGQQLAHLFDLFLLEAFPEGRVCFEG